MPKENLKKKRKRKSTLKWTRLFEGLGLLKSNEGHEKRSSSK